MTSGFSPRETAAVLAVGVIGVLIAGLQPQLLGALLAEGRVSAGGLGLLATVELLAMGIGAGVAGFVLSTERLRGAAFAGIAVAALADCATPFAPGAGLFASRIVAGVAEGVLIWIAIGLIVRRTRPERWSGIYLALQTTAQLFVATLLGLAVIPRYGATGGFLALALVTAAGMGAISAMPRRYPAPSQDAGEGGALPLAGIVALAGVTLYLAFIVAVWVYLEPIGRQRGIDPATLGLVAPVSLAMQVAGAASAAWLAGRIAPRGTVVAVLLADLGILVAMGAVHAPAAFLAASAAFGFLWLFVMPFQLPIVIAADPSRRAAMLIGGAQLVGSALGPFGAAFLVGDSDVMPVLWLGGACAMLGAAAMLASARRRSTGRQ